jgi:hypothetical protein
MADLDFEDPLLGFVLPEAAAGFLDWLADFFWVAMFKGGL